LKLTEFGKAVIAGIRGRNHRSS